MNKHIYFIKPVGMAGPIKIGCSKFVGNRLKALSMWSPIQLEVLYEEEGGFDLELKIHCCFADLHSHHEWFHPGERLLKAIARLRSGAKISEAIDLSDARGFIHGQMRRGPKPECETTKGLRSYKCKVRYALGRAWNATGEHMSAPLDIDGIMTRWEGNLRKKDRDEPARPTAEEFARLEEFLANPELHSIPFSQRRAA